MGEQNLTQLVARLNVGATQEESHKVEELCKRLLKEGCSNPGSVMRTCLVAIIKQDKYGAGIELLKKNKEIDGKHGEHFTLEKLYIYYKMNAIHDFEKLYAKIYPDPLNSFSDEKSRGLLHVRAQFCYKQGLYKEAFEIYHLLSKNNDEVFDNNLELACNERVPLTVKPDLIDSLTVLTQINEESYDILFNDSMIFTSRGEYNRAMELLEKARDIANNEGYKNDVKAIELQMAFVLQLKGNNKESHAILNKQLKETNDQTPFSLLAKMNQKSFNDFSKYTNNLNLVIRELDFKRLDSINNKQFTHEQWSIINRNCLFLHLFNNNSIQYGSSVLSRTLHNYSKLIDDISFESYKTQAKKLYHHAISMIKSGVTGSVVGFIVLSVQLLAVEKQWDNAIRLCEFYLNQLANSSLDRTESKYHVICYILFDLYKITGRNHSKSLLLTNISNEKKHISKNIPFWKHVGFQFLSLSNSKEAKKIFKEIYLYDNDAALGSFLSDDTPTLQKSYEITKDIDVSSLLDLGIQPLDRSKKREHIQTISKVKKRRVELKKKSKKDKRLKKFLESHTGTKNPDPERWLPLKDRSSYRPKKKYGLTKQTQGGAMNKKAEQALDITTKTKKPLNNSRRKKGRK